MLFVWHAKVKNVSYAIKNKAGFRFNQVQAHSHSTVRPKLKPIPMHFIYDSVYLFPVIIMYKYKADYIIYKFIYRIRLPLLSMPRKASDDTYFIEKLH